MKFIIFMILSAVSFAKNNPESKEYYKQHSYQAQEVAAKCNSENNKDDISPNCKNAKKGLQDTKKGNKDRLPGKLNK